MLKIEEHEYKYVVSLYKNGLTNREIANVFDVDPGTVTLILRKFNITRSPSKIFGKCIKCGIDSRLYKHHEKYLEIHGEEKIVLMCAPCHKRLHASLRKNKKCNIAPSLINRYTHQSTARQNALFLKRLSLSTDVGNGWLSYEVVVYDERSGNVSISVRLTNKVKLYSLKPQKWRQ